LTNSHLSGAISSEYACSSNNNQIKLKKMMLSSSSFFLEEDPTWPYILAGSLVFVLIVSILVGFLLWQR